MASRNHCLDVAANVEVADHLDIAGVEQRDQIVQDAVHRGLVEHFLVAELVDVELERLELHQLAVRNVFDPDGGEVGEARLGRKAGELGDGEVDLVISVGIAVGDRFQCRLRDHLRAIFHGVNAKGSSSWIRPRSRCR